MAGHHLTLRRAATVAALLLLSSCATRPPPPAAPTPAQPPVPSPTAPPAPVQPERFSDLPGWENEDHAAALEAFRATCGVAKDAGLAEACRRARALGPVDAGGARAFIEATFRPERIVGEGVLTGYFSPQYPARDRPDAEFSAPVRGKPTDLVAAGTGGKDALRRTEDGVLEPYPERRDIELSPPGQALAWMRPEDLFFLQIQGSGVLTFPDGRRRKAVFAATNGRPFQGIANPMRDRGLLARGDTSGEAIRLWLARNRGPAAEEVMRINPRYVFFTLALDDGRHPAGAAGAPLPPGRAIAVDPSRHAMGAPIYIEGVAPILNGAFPTYRRTVVALDVGGAIKGEVRADLYVGQGDAAGAEAGRIRHTLRMHRLVPRVGPGY